MIRNCACFEKYHLTTIYYYIGSKYYIQEKYTPYVIT